MNQNPLRHILRKGNENTWSDLLAFCLESDPGLASVFLGDARLKSVDREISLPGGTERPDLILTDSRGGKHLIENKVGEVLYRDQLMRYCDAIPDAASRHVLTRDDYSGTLKSWSAQTGEWASHTWAEVLDDFATREPSKNEWLIDRWRSLVQRTPINPNLGWREIDTQDMDPSAVERFCYLQGQLLARPEIARDLSSIPYLGPSASSPSIYLQLESLPFDAHDQISVCIGIEDLARNKRGKGFVASSPIEVKVMVLHSGPLTTFPYGDADEILDYIREKLQTVRWKSQGRHQGPVRKYYGFANKQNPQLGMAANFESSESVESIAGHVSAIACAAFEAAFDRRG